MMDAPQLGTNLMHNEIGCLDDLPLKLRSLACVHPALTMTLTPAFALQMARRIEDGPKLMALNAGLLDTANTLQAAQDMVRLAVAETNASARKVQDAMNAGLTAAFVLGVTAVMAAQVVARWL